MRSHVEIGSSPAEEECAQVGSPGYVERAMDECRRFRALIRARCGVEPRGAYLAIVGHAHDFGTYYEVVCQYDDDCPDAVNYAFRVENEAPTRWL